MTSRFIPAQLKIFPDTAQVMWEGRLYGNAQQFWDTIMSQADCQTEAQCHRESEVLLDPSVAKAIAQGRFRKYTPEGKAVLTAGEIADLEAAIQQSINEQELI